MELAKIVDLIQELTRQAKFVSQMYVQIFKNLFSMEHVKIVVNTHDPMI
jgi:hypothetical protein